MPQSARAQSQLLALGLALAPLFLACGSETEHVHPSAHPAEARAFPQGEGQLTFLDPFDPKRPYFFDFGTVSYGQRLTTVFSIANTGDGPLTILRAQPACSCTRVKAIRLLQEGAAAIPGSPSAQDGMLTIPPGEVCELEIELDTTKTQANQDKLAVMRVVTDEVDNPYQTLEIHVRAERLFELKPATVNLGQIPQYGGAGKTIQIYNRLLDRPAKLIEVIETSPGFEAKLEEIQATGVPFWNLTVRLAESSKLGGVRGKVTLSHSDARGEGDAGRISVDVFGQVTEPIVISPRNISFGSISLGSTAHVKSSLKTLLPGQRTRILKASIEGASAPHLLVETQALGEDEAGLASHFDVIVRSLESLPAGRLNATLILEMEDSQVPRIERPLHGFVR